ncbi:MAG: class I SAM-dependent methyltransferase [Betaproteobacteria bacterium]
MDYRDSHLAKGDTYDGTIAAQPFDAYMAKCEAEYLRDVVPRLTGGSGRYLDFACGTGRITAIVAPMMTESIGVDISESMLGAARAKCPDTRFVCADLAQQAIDLGQFDLITSFRFFGNAQHELRTAALRVISGLMRKGGHLVINSHRNPHAIGALMQGISGRAHEMDLSYWKIARMLRDQGLRIVAVRPIGVWVMRARLRTDNALNSRGARLAERAFRHRLWAPFAPDCILIARKP